MWGGGVPVEVYEWVEVTELTLTLPSEPTVSPSGPCYSSIHHQLIYEEEKHYGEYPNRPPYGDFFYEQVLDEGIS